MKDTVFLDRDGVINIDSADYIKTPDEFRFIPKSAEAVALLSRAGFRIIIITNQSVIGRQMATRATLDAIFKKMTDGVEAAGGKIDDIFFCPHTPDAGCDCRKPKPKMIRDACEKYGIDPSFAMMIGDSAKDMECAVNAGCSKKILVRTGNGVSAYETLKSSGVFPDYFAEDLYDAALWILKTP